MTDDFIAQMHIPTLPDNVPQRLESALRSRVDALLYQLREAKHRRYVAAFEIRLVRDAHKAILAASELKIPESKVWYAAFRRLVENLGYERTDVGFCKSRSGDDLLE
jgi:hypothetical protein